MLIRIFENAQKTVINRQKRSITFFCVFKNNGFGLLKSYLTLTYSDRSKKNSTLHPNVQL